MSKQPAPNSRPSILDDTGGSSNKKKKGKIKFGKYKLSSERKITKYAYVPSSVLRSSTFSFDGVFTVLGISVPNLIFEVANSIDVEEWNLRLPVYKDHLKGIRHVDPDEGIYDGQLRHYQGVIRENCKRLLRGTR